MGVSVDCSFADDGSVMVARVRQNGRWRQVGQGRQWVDANGRHALIQLPDQSIHELVLLRETLTWHWVTGDDTAVG